MGGEIGLLALQAEHHGHGLAGGAGRGEALLLDLGTQRRRRAARSRACGVRRGETKGVKQSVCFLLLERLRFCLFNLYCSREANTNLPSNFALPYWSRSKP